MSNISCSRTVLFISVVKHYIRASLSFGRHLVYNMLFPDVQGDQENKIWVKQIPSKLTILSPFIQVAVHVRKVCICVLGYQFRNCSIYYRSELVVSTVPVLYIEPFSFYNIVRWMSVLNCNIWRLSSLICSRHESQIKTSFK